MRDGEGPFASRLVVRDEGSSGHTLETLEMLDYDDYSDEEDDDASSDLSDVPDTPAGQQHRSSQMTSTPQDDSFDSPTQTQSSPDDTFDFKKGMRGSRASVPGGFGDDSAYMDEEEMDDAQGQSFLGRRSVGSLSSS